MVMDCDEALDTDTTDLNHLERNKNLLLCIHRKRDASK